MAQINKVNIVFKIKLNSIYIQFSITYRIVVNHAHIQLFCQMKY